VIEEAMSKVAIIASGFVGRAWAISFSRAGHDVALWDQDPQAPERALTYIHGLLPDLEASDLLNGVAAQVVEARMRPGAALEAGLDGAAYVQENAPEDVEVKRKVFAQLDAAAAPDAVLASSTSAILPSAFTATLKGRARCLVVRPINPPYLIPAAEIVPAPWTDAATVERAASLLRSAGHAPIMMKREIDGFVMNRLRGALLEEAFRLVAKDYASVEDIDTGLRGGLALRWSFIGPFEDPLTKENGRSHAH
jgi:L-gulonate 3-dehydrogenase